MYAAGCGWGEDVGSFGGSTSTGSFSVSTGVTRFLQTLLSPPRYASLWASQLPTHTSAQFANSSLAGPVKKRAWVFPELVLVLDEGQRITVITLTSLTLAHGPRLRVPQAARRFRSIFEEIHEPRGYAAVASHVAPAKGCHLVGLESGWQEHGSPNAETAVLSVHPVATVSAAIRQRGEEDLPRLLVVDRHYPPVRLHPSGVARRPVHPSHVEAVNVGDVLLANRYLNVPVVMGHNLKLQIKLIARFKVLRWAKRQKRGRDRAADRSKPRDEQVLVI